MNTQYPDVSALWDISQSTHFGQLPDDDFLAMLQKQFPLPVARQDSTQNITSFAAGGYADGVNPQNISRYSLPSLTPSSEDSSPSPPHDGSPHEPNGEEGGGGGGGGGSNDPRASKASAAESVLKRKASGVEMEEDGPSQKSQHTISNDRKATASGSTASRRKSTGNPAKDENRLLKRKEQNRAAQRAFRERKEKHVKDLEDKVAELEAKNEAAQNENENLRDLLGRLQSENVMLKQASFTFTMPPKPQSEPNPSAPRHYSPESSIYSTSPSSVISPETSQITPKPTNPLDWASLTSFDPNVLNLLDESPQPTATTSAMNLDLFGANTGLNSDSPFTMIASNPMFMSFASSFDTMTTSMDTQSNLGNDNGNRSNGHPFTFDMNAMSSWPTPTPSTQDTSLDDLFARYLNPNQNAGFSSSFTPTPSISPVTHQASTNTANFAHLNNSHLNSLMQQKGSSSLARTPSIPSPSSQSTASSDPLLSTPKEGSSVSASGSPNSDQASGPKHDKSQCPRTKSDLVRKIAEAGTSQFVGLQKISEHNKTPMVSCAGTAFPKTAKSDKNVEVLSAWRSITSNPIFKEANIDINDLCAEFTSKAKCDGTKVVLEPGEMNNIIESLTSKRQ